MGGILGGIVTPTEAANISVVYAAIVGGIMVRKNPPSLAVLLEACEEVVSRLAAVMLCVGAAVVLGWVMAIADVPEAIGEFIMSITTSPALITAGMLITYVVVGTFLDPIPGILIFTPIFLPIARQIASTLYTLQSPWCLDWLWLSYPSSRLLPLCRFGDQRTTC